MSQPDNQQVPPSSESPYQRPVVQASGKDMSGVNNVLFGCLGSIFIAVWELFKGIVRAIFG